MRKSRRWQALLLSLAAVLGLGANAVRTATPASAYMFMCCQFPRPWAPNLYAAVWPQHSFDNSSWFKAAVIDGFDAWNAAPTAVYVSLEFTEDSSAPIMYWTDTNPQDGSWGGCEAVDSNSECQFAVSQLAEGCTSNGCAMTEGSPNYDQATVAHEEGHDLGLDHDCVAGQLMSGPNSNCGNGGAPYACPSDSNCINTPQQQDIDGVVREYGSGSSSSSGNCSSTQPLLSAPPASTSITIPPIYPPPISIPTPAPPSNIPEQNYVYTVESAAGGAASNPLVTAESGAGAALAATGKVVPWSSVPSVTVGGRTIRTQPC